MDLTFTLIYIALCLGVPAITFGLCTIQKLLHE
ncbi:Hypothetical protein I5071_88110 [Sandaracinus amylolyticus]|nr:Hypothetical protein I5071_88110 [Sandaracinus amylolyticus]